MNILNQALDYLDKPCILSSSLLSLLYVRSKDSQFLSVEFNYHIVRENYDFKDYSTLLVNSHSFHKCLEQDENW